MTAECLILQLMQEIGSNIEILCYEVVKNLPLGLLMVFKEFIFAILVSQLLHFFK